MWKLAAMGRSNVSWVGEGGWTWERGVRGLKYRFVVFFKGEEKESY